MTTINMTENLLKYNNLIKETDEIYRQTARNFGMSECTLWIFYILRAEKEKMIQSEICTRLCQPKQTVNSALKKLENDGYICLLPGSDRRRKEICLTEKGAAFAEQTVDLIILAEMGALSRLSEEEQNTFIALFRKYTGLLREHMQTLETEVNICG